MTYIVLVSHEGKSFHCIGLHRNNNHGGVARGLHRGLAQPRHEALQGVAEQRAAEESGDESHSSPIVETSDVPQCFSHFTFVVTGGQKLVCDLQVRLFVIMIPSVSHDFMARLLTYPLAEQQTSHAQQLG
jgi:hypothetical protein